MNCRTLNGTAVAAALLLSAAPAMAASTLVAGSGTPFSNYQPSLVLKQGFALGGYFPPNSSEGLLDGADHYNMGMVRTYAANFSVGEQDANGALIAINANVATFDIIGNSYGGNGTSNFAIPNLAGVTIIGASSSDGQGAAFHFNVAQTPGSANVTLDVSQLPAHSHTLPGGGSTGSTGSGAPFDQLEPSVTMTYLIAGGGIYPNAGGGAEAVTIGQIAAFAGDFVPLGWRAADGAVLNIADNPNLFAIIGNTFGGDGITTFALPDLRGRTVVGAGTGAGLTPVTLGETFGSSSAVLTLGQMAAHDHDLPGGGMTGAAGGATPVSNEQLSIGLNYLIAVSGVFPSRGGTPAGDGAYLGEVIAVADNNARGGYLPADGRLLSIATNSALFSLLGTTYGGDGINTFALPDLRGRDVLGDGGGLVVGQKLGTESTVLSVANLPAHDHTFTAGVPEPSTWTMLILGLGFAGAGLRRRRAGPAVA